MFSERECCLFAQPIRVGLYIKFRPPPLHRLFLQFSSLKFLAAIERSLFQETSRHHTSRLIIWCIGQACSVKMAGYWHPFLQKELGQYL